MRYIFVLRMYSGLIKSLDEGEWRPFGVPAIYKLIEEFAKRKIPLTVLFLCKTEAESKNVKGIKKVEFKELKNVEFYIIKYYSLSIQSTKLKQIYNDFRQFCSVIFKFYLKNKYEVVYLDRVNIVLAAFLSLLGVKTVVRFLGIGNFKYFTDNLFCKIFSPLVYLSLKVPHSLIICTEDGSPSHLLFHKCLNKKTPFKILLNGVDNLTLYEEELPINFKYNFNKKYPILLFVGRLTEDKGAEEFINALIKLDKISRKFYAILICGGEDFAFLHKKVFANGLQHQVIFEKYIEPNKIYNYYEQSDIYISLNKLGNLSNTVLEAMNSGKCIVMLDKDEKTNTDESTKELIPDEVVIRISRNNIVEDLTEKLADLVDNREKIKIYSERMKKFAKEFLWTWDGRINYEMQLLEMVSKGVDIK